MTVEDTFTIDWSIPEEQWERARRAVRENAVHSDYDRRALARNYLLYGDIDFSCGGARLYGSVYGTKGVNISVLDLALALSVAHLKQVFVTHRGTTYEQLDDDRRIAFKCTNETVEIRASDRPEPLVVDREPFARGLVTFLCGFASSCTQQAEGLMKWDTTGPLRDFARRFCGN
jgi:hypothetical protein